MLINGTIVVEVDAVDLEQAAIEEKPVIAKSTGAMAVKAAQQNPELISLKRLLMAMQPEHAVFFDMAVPRRGNSGAKVHFSIRPLTKEELENV